MKKTRNTLLLSMALLALAGCSAAKEQLGATKKAPDEFAVIKRAPLAMPPDYTLRPPRPGAVRPQEQAMGEQARQTVFGDNKAQSGSNSDAESILLQKAGSTSADPDIRDLVDQDAASADDRDQPVAKKLLGLGKDKPPPADVVDAKGEAERLKQNAEEGKPVTEGETPSIEN